MTERIFLQRGILIFIILLCGSIGVYPEIIGAQTMVCSGDSVVLVLNGYKHGSVLWQQSSDQTTWSNAQGISHDDSLVITILNISYYRATVTDGTCSPVYSDTVLLTIKPAPSPPVANAASNVTLISFDANWMASVGSTAYYIDVATDVDFTSFVSGYKNLSIGNVTTHKVTGLTGSTKYYYRVRASNSCPSNNSNTILVTTATPVYCTVNSTCSGNITDTRDSKIYKTVQIGSQCWMAQNLNVGTMIQGDKHQIPGADNQNASIEKYCYNNDSTNNCKKYGGLYRWDEMMAYGLSDSTAPGPRGICPIGWHLPTDNEWTCLEDNLGGSTTAGGKLKDTTLWNNPNTGATNGSGFTALPGGIHENVTSNAFFHQGNQGSWWTTTESTQFLMSTALVRNLTHNNAGVYRGDGGLKAAYGYSVRCVKD